MIANPIWGIWSSNYKSLGERIQIVSCSFSTLNILVFELCVTPHLDPILALFQRDFVCFLYSRVRNGYPWVGFSTFIPTRWVYPLWGGYLGQEPTHPAGYPPGLPRTQSRASYIYIHFSILFQRIHCISLPNSIITIKITIYFQY